MIGSEKQGGFSVKRTILALTMVVILVLGAAPLVVLADGSWNTNLGTMTPVEAQPAGMEISDKGVTVSKTTGWDAIAISDTKTEGDFMLETDVTFVSGNVANLVFGAEKSTTAQESFVCKLDRNNAQCLFADSLTPELGKTYHVELTYQDGKLTYVFGGVTIFEEVADANSDDSFTGGRVGVMGFYSTFVVNNVIVSSLTEEEPSVTQEPPVTQDPPATGDHLMSMLLVLGAFGLIGVSIFTKRRNLG